MKEIELLKDGQEGLCDESLGHYKIIKEGMDDIVLIKNMQYKNIKTKEVNIMGQNTTEYMIETLTNKEKYIVKPLDTLNSIALRFNKTPEEIRKNNDLKTDKLFIGQLLEM